MARDGHSENYVYVHLSNQAQTYFYQKFLKKEKIATRFARGIPTPAARLLDGNEWE